jgi:hypothetical protein
MRTNLLPESMRTHEGAKAYTLTTELELRRSVLSCFLWEDSFYENGVSIAERISTLCDSVEPEKIAKIAIEAREVNHLRHAPLWLICGLARNHSGDSLVSDTVERVIQRVDEIPELLSLYSLSVVGVKTKNGRTKKLGKLSNGIKNGIARAFTKFTPYQLAKYNRKGAITLKDALFVSHAKPITEAQGKAWKDLINGELATPDTWEVALSGGADKKETFIRLIAEKKLGALALLRNLRNMDESGVPIDVIKGALAEANVSRVLPFRFIAAAQFVPQLEEDLEKCMLRSIQEQPKIPGSTAMLIDHSGSMPGYQISEKSKLDRFDAATALAMIARETFENIRTFAFSEQTVEVPSRHGFALRDAIGNCMGFGMTRLGAAIEHVGKVYNYDRIIVITDEQSHDRVGPPKAGSNGYMINVATYKNGVGYGPWTHIDGWSESVLKFIAELENFGNS